MLSKFNKILLGLSALMMASCATPESETTTVESKKESFTFAVWGRGVSHKKSDEELKSFLQKYRDAGITDFYLSEGPEQLKRIIDLTQDMGVQIHGWIWTLNRPGDKVAMEHPEWYAVNRRGDNSLDFKPYVGYYQWLSPFSPGAREHIKNNIRKIAEVPGLASVHLDYVRYCDVILGRDLQPKYKLVQDHQMHEYDFGYHPEGRKGFEEIFGYDPLDLDNPELSTEWLQYRLNAVSTLVNELADIAHSHDKKLSAAVFPFPTMSRNMVRQDWSAWNLDIALPMNYHNFYLENINWIGFSVENGVRELRDEADYISGLYLPALKPMELKRAITLSKEKGANGVSIFEMNGLSEEHLNVIKELNTEYNAK